MTLKSMTGFARIEGNFAEYSWYWEIKSVNGKGLDIRTRIPSFLTALEVEARKKVSAALTRGSVYLVLNIDHSGLSEQMVVNEERLKTLLAISDKYKTAPGIRIASLDGLLSVKGVIELASDDMTEETKSSLHAALLDSLSECLTRLDAAKIDEGKRMQSYLMGQLQTIRTLVSEITQLTGDRLEAMKARFQSSVEKVYDGQGAISEDRLVQEIAILAVKADIQEEIDRLLSHMSEAEKLLESDKPVGRRLDFLTQEFNREANTLCAKSGDSQLTRIGIELKTTIDQFREQIQNIE